MKQHVAKVATACFYHLRGLRQIRRRVGEEVTTRLILALVIPRLDYCNSLLAGLPLCTTEALQRVQNTAARLINYSNSDKDQVRRAGLLLRRPVRVEHTAAPYPRYSQL